MVRSAGCLTGSVAILGLLACNPAGPVHLVSVRIVPATDTLGVGQTVRFGLSETWTPGITPPPTNQVFSTDNPDIASVGSWGSVQGKSPGRVRLTGCVGDVCDSRMLTVTP